MKTRETRSPSLGEFIDDLEAAAPEPLITLNGILKEANCLGYGKISRLRSTFIGYQKIGLLGNYVEKEPRQGGAGLWHPSQGYLFNLYLRLRKEQKGDTNSMANIPVGFWLLELALGKWIPISIEQTQKAFEYATKDLAKRWIGHVSPVEQSKTSSKIRRSIQETNRAFASRGRKVKTHNDREVFERFSQLDFKQAQPGVSLHEFLTSGLAFKETKPEYQDMLKQAAYHEVQNRLIALKYREELLLPDTRPFWYWARQHWLDAMEWGSQRQLQYKSITSIEMMPESVNTILEKSIIYLLGQFGWGIKQIQTGRSIPGVPPKYFQ
jgi:hypothetical protein